LRHVGRIGIVRRDQRAAERVLAVVAADDELREGLARQAEEPSGAGVEHGDLALDPGLARVVQPEEDGASGQGPALPKRHGLAFGVEKAMPVSESEQEHAIAGVLDRDSYE